MNTDDDISIILALPDTTDFRATVVKELTAMARGTPPYEDFRKLPARARIIWRVAATLIGTDRHMAN